MQLFEHVIDIAAPPERVWAIIREPARWHEWTASITGIRMFGGNELVVGRRALVRQPKLPPALWTVTEVAPLGFTWVSRGPGLTATGRHYVKPQGSGSRVTLSLSYDGLFSGVMARLAGEITDRYIGYEAAGLKQRAENS
ncbi:MAG: SRPBCC family protein [Vicinamibacterales bacterium]